LDAVIVEGMTSRSVLISGAGVAGPTLAYWLARSGFQPTIVERSQGPRSSGNPVDVRGPALPVAERMGLMPALREVATPVTAMSVVDDEGREVTRVATPASRSTAGTREVEVPRGDLAAVLYQAARDDAEFLFDDTITTLAPDDGAAGRRADRPEDPGGDSRPQPGRPRVAEPLKDQSP
jgi:2-polyprenyl-6-methoxyphenol hydroxylase-like FAD-dependent oxidoreductase